MLQAWSSSSTAFSKRAQRFTVERAEQVEEKIDWFLDATAAVPREIFLTRQGRFSLPLFESVFAAAAERGDSDPEWSMPASAVTALASDPEFLEAASQGTTSTSNVKTRLRVGKKLLDGPG